MNLIFLIFLQLGTIFRIPFNLRQEKEETYSFLIHRLFCILRLSIHFPFSHWTLFEQIQEDKMMSHTHFHHMCSVSFSKHFFTRFSKTRRTIRRRTRGRRRSRKRRIRKNAICTFVYTHWVNATYDFQIRSPRKESVGKRSEQLLSPLCRELNKDIHILVWTFQHPRPICIWQCGTKIDMQKRLMANLENLPPVV